MNPTEHDSTCTGQGEEATKKQIVLAKFDYSSVQIQTVVVKCETQKMYYIPEDNILCRDRIHKESPFIFETVEAAAKALIVMVIHAIDDGEQNLIKLHDTKRRLQETIDGEGAVR